MVAAVGCGGGDQQVAEDAIKIGIQGPMSGPMALEGQGFEGCSVAGGSNQ